MASRQPPRRRWFPRASASPAGARPGGLALRLRDCLRRCRERPPPRWPPRAYALVGRDDLAAAAAEAVARPARGSPSDSLRAPRRRRCAATGASCLAASPSLGALDPRARTAFGDGDDAGLDAETPGSTANDSIEHGAGVGSVPENEGNDDAFVSDPLGGADALGSLGGSLGASDFAAAGSAGGGARSERVTRPLITRKRSLLASTAWRASSGSSAPCCSAGTGACVRRALLASAAPASIALGASDAGAGAGAGGDPEAVVAQQARLWSLAPRTAALALGAARSRWARRARGARSRCACRP